MSKHQAAQILQRQLDELSHEASQSVAVKAGEWIKCSDRLPGDELDGMCVIVAVRHCHRGLIAETDVWVAGRPTSMRQKGSFAFWANTASHWMPLPQPPTA